MTTLDQTHDPMLRSWVASANGHEDFPIQNLPFGCFSIEGGPPRGGIAIGERILDLQAAHADGLLTGNAVEACCEPTLNAFLALRQGPRQALRHAVSALLTEGAPPHPSMLHEAAACTMHMPATVGDYTDFYAGIHHATNVSKLLRRDPPLYENYSHMPTAYHGRASSLRVSGFDIRRPNGQRKRGADTEPSAGPSRNLDYEIELGIWIGPGNDLGTSIPLAEANTHIAGFCLLNDWSARDIQGWESQPLGPFLGKSFCTTISPWMITPEAMAPFRMKPDARPEGEAPVLDYLRDETDAQEGALDVRLEVTLLTQAMRDQNLSPHRLSTGHARHLYWTAAQMIAHHTINGCNLQPGDLFGTGTISGPTPEEAGSLLELSQGGRQPIPLASGETRRFLEDGDTIAFHARTRRDGFVGIGFGPCEGTILPARIS